MSVDIVDIGDVPQLKGYFRDAATKQLTDPSTVTFRIKEPDGTVTVYTYGVSSQLVKDATGTYRVNWPVAKAGKHYYRFEGTGNVQAAGNQAFYARDVYEV